MQIMKEIIIKELKIWQEAYPEWKDMLEKFANKIYLELNLVGNKIKSNN